MAAGDGWGGGISIDGGGAGTVQGNRIEGNRTNGGDGGEGAGIHQWQGPIHFTDNQAVGNHGSQDVQWRVSAKNPAGTSLPLSGHAVCLSFP